MLLTNQSSFKIARRHLKRFSIMPVLLFLVIVGAGASFILYSDQVKGTFKDFIYDGSALLLSLMEKPFNSVRGYQQNFKHHLFLQKKAHLFEKMISQLEAYKHKAQSLEMRNRELRDLLSLQGDGGEPFITAQCFGQNAFLNTQSLFIHAGHRSGIKRFDVVLSEGTLIGQVDRVGGKTSRVLLINDSRSRIPIVCGKSQQEGVLYGDLDGNLTLSFVKTPGALQEGEMLFSSGVDGYFPRGKPLGTVSKIKGEKVFIDPLVDFKNLHYVQIQKSHGGEVQ